MLDQLIMDVPVILDIKDAKRIELEQYCKMENVLPSSLISVGKPKHTMKLKFKKAACHLLQHINGGLSIMINRLTTDIEHSGGVRRRLS